MSTTKLWDDMRAALAQTAQVREIAEETGLPMPANVRQQLDNLRNRLHDNGLSWADIDATPGLHPATTTESNK